MVQKYFMWLLLNIFRRFLTNKKRIPKFNSEGSTVFYKKINIWDHLQMTSPPRGGGGVCQKVTSSDMGGGGVAQK